MLWLAELKSTIAVQRKFRIKYNEEPPHRNIIVKWIKKFKETGSVHDKPRSGRPCVSEFFVNCKIVLLFVLLREEMWKLK